MRCSSTQHHSLSKLFTGSFLAEIQGQTQKIQKGVAGTLAHLPTCQQYYRYFHFSESFLKITQNFKENGWPVPFGPPLIPHLDL